MKSNQALLTRIESRIFGADNGCLEWLSTLSEDGYGKVVAAAFGIPDEDYVTIRERG